MYLYIVFHINSVFIHYFPYFTRRKNKNNLREFEPQNSKKFKNIQAEFKNLVSYKKKKVYERSDWGSERPVSGFERLHFGSKASLYDIFFCSVP